jgi:hypothetical protein
MHGEVDSFFTYLAYWITYYTKVEEVLGQHDLPRPDDIIMDNPEKFRDWADRMIEAKQREKETKPRRR